MLACQVVLLKPNSEQEPLFCRHASAARIARNDLIAVWKDEGRRLPGFRYKLSELRPVLNKAKLQQRPWFAELSQNAVKGGYIDAEDAIARYYTKQNKRPKFHGKGHRRRFRADNGVDTIKIDEDGRLLLPRKMGGAVKLGESLRWPGKVIRECRIGERGGRWYASIRVEITASEYGLICGDGKAGIDLGVKALATICWPDGSYEELVAPEPLKHSLTALRRSNRKLSRRKKGGKNWLKAKAEVSRRHSRMTNIRKDFLHQATHRITAECSRITMENINLKAWQRRWGRKVSDLAPGEFRRQVEYKIKWRGGEFVKAPRSFPSTQLCPDCGAKTGPKNDLAVREWTCSACGVFHRRDEASSRNLKEWPGAAGQQPDGADVRRATARVRQRPRNRDGGDVVPPAQEPRDFAISAD